MQYLESAVEKLVVFTVTGGQLKVCLSQSFLPYGNIRTNETLDIASRRIFEDEIGHLPANFYFEQLCTVSEGRNDKSIISVIYFFLIPDMNIGEDKSDHLIDVKNMTGKISEHEIIDYAVQRLRWKIEYTNVVYSLLAEEFTLSELQGIYETILGQTLDKRNFRKKILSLNLVRSTRHQKRLGCARPAEMFAFSKRELVMAKIFS